MNKLTKKDIEKLIRILEKQIDRVELDPFANKKLIKKEVKNLENIMRKLCPTK